MAALLFLHHNVVNETVREHADLQKSACSLRRCTIWHRVSGTEARLISCTQNARQHLLHPIWTEVGRNQEILADRVLSAGVRRQAPLNQVSFLFELSSLVFTSKDMKGVADSRTASPQFLSLESALSAAVVSFQEATGAIVSH